MINNGKRFFHANDIKSSRNDLAKLNLEEALTIIWWGRDKKKRQEKKKKKKVWDRSTFGLGISNSNPPVLSSLFLLPLFIADDGGNLNGFSPAGELLSSSPFLSYCHEEETRAQKDNLEMVIAVAPDSLTLIGPTEAKIGELITYECITGISNPAADIQFVVGNVTQRPLSVQTVTSDEGGFVTRANITVSLSPDDRSKMVICKAINNELNDIKSEAKMLSIICK